MAGKQWCRTPQVVRLQSTRAQPVAAPSCTTLRLRHLSAPLNRYLTQRVPSLSLASSFTMCLDSEGLKGMFPWRTRYPSS